MPANPAIIPDNSGESVQDIRLNPNPRKKMLPFALVFAIVIIIAVSVIAILHNQKDIVSSSTSQITTPITVRQSNSSNKNISSFAAEVSLPVGPGYYSVAPEVIINKGCNYTGYVVWYIKNGYPSNSSAPVNYSKINQTAPFALYVKVGTSGTMSAYRKALQNNRGYCSQIFDEIAKNSSFTSLNVSFSENSEGYLLSFTNFSSEGLKITNTSYIGPKPNVIWKYTNVVYGNVIISIGAWGLGNNVKSNDLVYFTNYIISQYNNFST